VSVLGALAIVAATTGSGIFTEAGYDLLLSDRLSFAARGQRLTGEVGYFHGDYMGSYGFGPYFRYGLGMSWEPLYVAETAATTHSFYPHLTLTRGVDIFKIGVWGKLRLGPTWSVMEESEISSPDTVWGGQATAELSVSYNVATVLKIAPRVGFGILIDEVRTSYQATLGIGIELQAALRRIDSGRPADYWEKDY